MISHKQKMIFIHIPKCAGSSINNFYFNPLKLDWKVPNYDFLYGWCPLRNIHLQHATSKQLIELDLISKSVWEEYFKFTIVRNPYDRAYSDYLWIQRDSKIKGSFCDYIKKKGPFKKLLNDKTVKEYRGDHLTSQTDFFEQSGALKLDFVGRFENLTTDLFKLNSILGIKNEFNIHSKRNKSKKNHYSMFYTNSKKKLVENYYTKDLQLLNYSFKDNRRYIYALKKFF